MVLKYHGRVFSANDSDASRFDRIDVVSDTSFRIPNSQRDDLKEIDCLRSNSDWQAYRNQLYELPNRICEFCGKTGKVHAPSATLAAKLGQKRWPLTKNTPPAVSQPLPADWIAL